MATTTMSDYTLSIPSLREAKRRLGSFVSAIGEHRILMLAGSIAYTTALALAPFVLIMLAFASLLGQRFQDQMYSQMTSLLGEQAGQAIKIVVENADNNQSLTTISGIFGFLVLAVGASAVFSSLRSALDIINETPEEKTSSGIWGFFRDKFLSLGLVFGFVFLAITSLAVTALLSGAFAGGEAMLWTAVSFVANLILFTALFTMMFRFIPTERLEWKPAMIAGLCATVFFLIGKSLIGIYLGNASVGSEYGAAGTFVVFLVWVYYTTATLLISYEFATNVFLKDVVQSPNVER
jgi:membrane protein